MDFLKRSWAQIGVTFERMSFAEKGLITAMVVIGLLVVGIGLFFASSPQRVSIPSGSDINASVALLQRHGIDAKVQGSQLLVPLSRQHDALSKLADHDRLGGDATEAFAKLVQADPWETNAQMRSKYIVALQSYLSKVVNRMQGVRSASVMIAMPEQKGFGRTSAKPSASVMIEMRGGDAVSKDMVKAIASLVSGAVAELSPQAVEVIDSSGRSYSIDDPEEQLPTRAIELARSEEKHHQNKIESLLMIRGAIVAVSVDLDPIRRELRNTTEYLDNPPIKAERTSEISTRDITQGGEAGVRSNNGLDIAGGGGVSREHTEATTETEFNTLLPKASIQTELAGHQVQRIHVTINVPRNYFVGIFKARNPDAEAPDDAALQPIVDEQLARITEKVEPIITRGETKGVVAASMYFDEQYLAPVTAGVGSGMGEMMGSWSGTAAAAALALMALGMMLYMVKRTTQEEAMPTVEELAGIPQSLPADDDLLGEAEEVESTMAGVELDEGQLQARKVAEQISEMIKSSPAEAGSLLSKWVAVDDR